MPEQLEASPSQIPSPVPASREILTALPANPAVALCCVAWQQTYKTVLARGKHEIIALMDASDAYRRAMPPLFGSRNIRDFIACVAHGMLAKMIRESSATKLLYAAQVAHNTLPKRSPRPRKRSV